MLAFTKLLIFDETIAGEAVTWHYSDPDLEPLLASMDSLAFEFVIVGLGVNSTFQANLEMATIRGDSWPYPGIGSGGTPLNLIASGTGFPAGGRQINMVSVDLLANNYRFPRARLAVLLAGGLARIKVYATGRIKDSNVRTVGDPDDKKAGGCAGCKSGGGCSGRSASSQLGPGGAGLGGSVLTPMGGDTGQLGPQGGAASGLKGCTDMCMFEYLKSCNGPLGSSGCDVPGANSCFASCLGGAAYIGNSGVMGASPVYGPPPPENQYWKDWVPGLKPPCPEAAHVPYIDTKNGQCIMSATTYNVLQEYEYCRCTKHWGNDPTNGDPDGICANNAYFPLQAAAKNCKGGGTCDTTLANAILACATDSVTGKYKQDTKPCVQAAIDARAGCVNT